MQRSLLAETILNPLNRRRNIHRQIKGIPDPCRS
jgi:hypothetical protein